MTNSNDTLLSINIPGLKKLRSGKVREIFDLGDRLLFLATDRISAFDVIMPTGIPLKGRVLSSISKFWFEKTAHIIPNHVLTMDFADFPAELHPYRQQLEGRAMIVRTCKPLAVECIVRGYLAGSGWKEYKQSQSVCGVKLPSALLESSELPEPIFTPSTKAQSGHDINISYQQSAKILGQELAERVHDASLAIYKWARAFARERGIIIADTKFEFGLLPGGEVILIDEVLTPDSSRFWPASEYQPGRSQPSFDKQFVRDYLETLDWNKTPPGPKLPEEIVAKTSEKYLEAYRRITGTEL
ncbi:MAG: phosphoribosylaminoimidazolesuccinocarboxamide synthase [Verrucomicrobia bacterium GWF2_62_7]|nr:MAG: phosphoribosylaminoimidazolesuccinocarboxamide synthase [Verrucomicrobia bacterium GWF2_62_7]